MLKRKYRNLIFGLFLLISIGCAFFWKYKKPYPDILLITVDALRPDHLGCYGYPKNTSPNIDRLAKEGVTFTQAIAQGSVTYSSIPSLFTSLYPSSHGIEEAKEIAGSLSPATLTLTNILKAKGYRTAAISGHGYIFSTILGFGSAFDSIYEYSRKPANEITQIAIKWLRGNQHKPYFLWLHYMDSHTPYKPPSPYNELYLPSKLKKGEGLVKKYDWVKYEWANNRFMLLPKQYLEGNLTQEDREYYTAQYDGAISFIDEQIGILWQELEKLKLDKEILVILTSDHGENPTDYSGFFGHGNNLHDVEIKIPLVIRGRKIPKDRIISRQVSSIDIMPTILDFLRININAKIEGRSLLPLILNKRNKYEPYAFSELFFRKTNRRLKSIRSEEWKLIYDLANDTYELYNLREDPKETNNLIAIELETFASLRQKLQDWMNRPIPSKSKITKPLDEETKEGLRNLGYLQ